ncbi:MAG: discoidin domain-containing protein, partial [Lentisphaeraceae bacterium]|nr:discoidin domain-containing protein [Lentisphaeraceae bacterium]
DKDAAVLSQFMLTAKYLDIPNWKDKALAISEKSKLTAIKSIYTTLIHEKAKKGTSRKFSKDEKKLLAKGKLIYTQLCSECHGGNARGHKAGSIKLAPSLVQSERVLGSKEAVANILLYGMTGKIDGHAYPGNIMIPMGSNGDAWVASVLSYVRTNFGNNSTTINTKEVKAIRAAAKGRTLPWKFSELTATHATAMLKQRKDWKVTASIKSKYARSAVNGNLRNRYDTGKKQAPGMWLQIELPQAKELHGLVLNADVSAADYPRGYKVQLSKDGKKWSKPVAQGEGNGSLTSITFQKAAKAKFVRITLTKADKFHFWSIHDLYLIGK